jgi:hypothetical protein
MQQHGCRSEVLRRPSEERQCVNVGICIDIRALVGASVVIACCPAQWRCRCAAARLVDSRTALTPVAIPLTGLLLHRDVLCRSSVVGLDIHAYLLVEKGQLLIELASRLHEFVEPRPPLGVCGAESVPVRSCLMRRPRRRCIPAWGHVAAWSVPSESL